MYNIVLASSVRQCDPDTYILLQILFHDGLLQDIEYDSLYYTVGPCCPSLGIFNIQKLF